MASAFVDLQDERHLADYDNHKQWGLTEVQETLDTAQSAFQDWQFIHADPMAGNFFSLCCSGSRADRPQPAQLLSRPRIRFASFSISSVRRTDSTGTT